MSRKTRKRPIRKRSFLLFELMLAMGLLLLCLFPMIKTHVGIARADMKHIQTLQQEQKVRAALCTLKMDLHEHIYSWEKLMKGVENNLYTLEKIKKSTKFNSESGMILRATFSIGKEEVTREVYVEKALDNPR